MKVTYENFLGLTYRVTTKELPFGGWTVYYELIDEATADIVCQSCRAIASDRTSTTIPDGVFHTHNSPAMQRTLTEICKDADRHKDDTQSLFQLKEEVEQGSLNNSERSFALEYIQDKIEVIAERARRFRARKNFEED